ncbi:MAG: hypothetical protein H7124_06625 [Phycisphaerales bacterium]|nr:hypothetical protein [Hyphomonadaceae bacterium]
MKMQHLSGPWLKASFAAARARARGAVGDRGRVVGVHRAVIADIADLLAGETIPDLVRIAAGERSALVALDHLTHQIGEKINRPRTPVRDLNQPRARYPFFIFLCT